MAVDLREQTRQPGQTGRPRRTGRPGLAYAKAFAAALERYRIVMEWPSGVRLRKLNHVRTIRGTTAIEGNTLTEDQVADIIAGKKVIDSKHEIDEVKGAHAAYSKVEVLDPLSSRARGESQGGKKTADQLLELICGNPKITFAEMVSAAGISRSAIQRHIERLKAAQRLRRIGPDKGGHWEVIEKA